MVIHEVTESALNHHVGTACMQLKQTAQIGDSLIQSLSSPKAPSGKVLDPAEPSSSQVCKEQHCQRVAAWNSTSIAYLCSTAQDRAIALTWDLVVVIGALCQAIDTWAAVVTSFECLDVLSAVI